MAHTTHFEREIREQPEIIRTQIARGRAASDAVAQAIRAFNPKSVVIAARGSSDNAARYAQYVFGAHNRLTVALAAPSLFTIYGAEPSLAGMLVIGVSQSGQSPDIAAVVQAGARQGAMTVAITNDPASPLAKSAAHCLPLYAGEERAVAATKTYTSQLVALAMLSASLEVSESRWADITALPEHAANAIASSPPAEPLASRFRYAERFVVIGRGFNYATAFEVALKLKETSYVVAEPYSSADFRHGPAALLEKGFPVVLIAPSGGVVEDVAGLFALLDERRTEVVAISDQASILDRARTRLPVPANVPEWLSPVVTVIPGQLFALGLATTRGLDPDAPRGLSKVTHTR
jgi:glucosamine--fructose-6-phosphate aminotransferase (isomerizing)